MGTARRGDVSAARSWAVCLPCSAAEATAGLRTVPGITVLVTATQVWLRGEGQDEGVARLLHGLPDAQHYVVGADGWCMRPGARVPLVRLPAGSWSPLRTWAVGQWPTLALPATPPIAAALTLVRSAVEQPANLLLTNLRALAACCDHLAEVRLRPLRMAAHADGSVLVHGVPLLPMPGRPFVETHGVALPTGHRLSHGSTQVVAERIGLQPGDLACFLAPGVCTIVRNHSFVAVRRSAVRLSLQRQVADG